jgi:hypothetical protein
MERFIKVVAFNYEDKNLPDEYAKVYQDDQPWRSGSITGKELGRFVVIKTKDNHRLVIYTGEIATQELNTLQTYPVREKWHGETKDTFAEVVEKTLNCEQVDYNLYNNILSKV